MKAAEAKLTDREEAFCLSYARSWSATDAARETGIDVNTGYRWLKLPHIKWRVRELAKDFAAEVHVEAGSILRELMFLANFDPLELFDERGHLKDLKSLPQYARKAIREITVETTYAGEDASGIPLSVRVSKVKMHPKERALDMLGRFKKLFGSEEEDKTRRVSVHIHTGQGKKS